MIPPTRDPAPSGEPLPEAVRELQRIRAEMRGRLGPSWPPNDQAGTWVHEWMERIRKVEALWEAAAQQERTRLDAWREQILEAAQWVTNWLNNDDAAGLPSVENRLTRIASEMASRTPPPEEKR